MTHTSSVSTNVSAHEDLPGYRLISIHDLAAPPLGSSYPDSSDEGYVFVRECVAPDFSGVRDREALLAFQAAADYCFASSDDSSEEDYDLAWKISMVELAEWGNDAQTTWRTHRRTDQLSHRRTPLRPEQLLRRTTPKTNVWNIHAKLCRFYP